MPTSKYIVLSFLLLITAIISQTTQSQTINPTPLKLLSYNVYFDDKSGKKRYPKIIKMLKQGHYDVIALQECTPIFLTLLRKEPKFARYFISQGTNEHGFTNLVLTNQKVSSWGNIKTPSNMGRSAPYIVLKNSNTLITSVHLESGLFDKKMRIEQLKKIIYDTEKFTNVVITGDVNFGDDADEENLLTEFIDLGAKKKQVTYDVENNTLAAHTKYLFEQSRRLDRFFVKCNECKLSSFKVNDFPFSDHWPIESKLLF